MDRNIYHAWENSEMRVEFWLECLKRKILLDNLKGIKKLLKTDLKTHNACISNSEWMVL
jgi:hypothetical protein